MEYVKAIQSASACSTSRDEPTPIPKIPRLAEEDFPLIQGRALVLLSSDRTKGFPFGEILKKLRQEGVQDANSSTVAEALGELNVRELAFQNVFGDSWYVNPAIRVVPSRADVPNEAVQARILEFLRKIHPTKVQKASLVRRFCEEDSRVKPQAVTKALSKLISAKLVLIDKSKRCYANPYPPKSITQRPKVQSEQTDQAIELNEVQLLRIPDVASAHRSRVVHMYKGNVIVREQSVGSKLQDSNETVRKLLSEVLNGKFSGLEFEDHLGGRVRIWTDWGVLKGFYFNKNRESLEIMLSRLGDVDPAK